jgi:hypothetical protein
VYAVCIVCHVTHNLIKHGMLAAQIRTQMTTAHNLIVLNNKTKIVQKQNTNLFLQFFFIYIVPEVLMFVRFDMQRPKRQAAQDAILKIRDIREWATLPESSKCFKECAACIDPELESEIEKKKVKTCDLDVSDHEEEESDDEFYDADDGFVVADRQILDADPDFKINQDEENMSENDRSFTRRVR